MDGSLKLLVCVAAWLGLLVLGVESLWGAEKLTVCDTPSEIFFFEDCGICSVNGEIRSSSETSEPTVWRWKEGTLTKHRSLCRLRGDVLNFEWAACNRYVAYMKKSEEKKYLVRILDAKSGRDLFPPQPPVPLPDDPKDWDCLNRWNYSAKGRHVGTILTASDYGGNGWKAIMIDSLTGSLTSVPMAQQPPYAIPHSYCTIPSKDGRRLGYIDGRDGVGMIDVEKKQKIWSTKLKSRYVSTYCGRFSSDEKLFWVGCAGGDVWGLDAQSGEVRYRWCATKTGKPDYDSLGSHPNVNHLAVSPDDEYVAGAPAGWDGAAYVWSKKSGKVVRLLHYDFQRNVEFIAFSPDSKYLATYDDHTLKIWPRSLWGEDTQGSAAIHSKRACRWRTRCCHRKAKPARTKYVRYVGPAAKELSFSIRAKSLAGKPLANATIELLHRGVTDRRVVSVGHCKSDASGKCDLKLARYWSCVPGEFAFRVCKGGCSKRYSWSHFPTEPSWNFYCPTELAKDFTNRIDMKFKLIPAGEFMMGKPKEEPSRDYDNRPVHRVRITKPYWLGEYEVTQSQWERVMGSKLEDFRKKDDWDEKWKFQGQGPNYPMYWVSWYDAIEFCNKLSELEGRTPSYRLTDIERETYGKKTGIKSAKVTMLKGNGYRLPTEAEWEYACRVGTRTPFYFGDALNGKEANCDGDTIPYGTKTKGPDLERTTHVGSYAANDWGLYDMPGNVWEWCSDWYDEKYYERSPVEDPTGPKKGDHRVARGGGWDCVAMDCRSAYRGWTKPTTRCCNLGLRIVLAP